VVRDHAAVAGPFSLILAAGAMLINFAVVLAMGRGRSG